MKIKKLYIIHGWVNEQRDRRGNLPEHPFNKTTTVINNKETAKAIFSEMKSEIKTYEMYSKYVSGHCQLFEPHIFEPGGTLASWPDENKYIDKYEFSK